MPDGIYVIALPIALRDRKGQELPCGGVDRHGHTQLLGLVDAHLDVFVQQFGGEAYRETAVEHALRNARSEEHTSELQSLMRISYAVFCLKKKKEDILYTNN